MSDIILGAFADEAGGSLEAQIAAMLDNGIQNLEARNIQGRNFVDFTVEEAKRVKEQLDANGLRIWSIGSPLGKIGARDPFGPHLDKLKHTLELAQVMGSERIRMFSFFVDTNHAEEYRDEVMERLSQMIEVAQGSGVMLCHENEKGIYGDTVEHCLDVLNTFPQLGGIFDPANFIQCHQDTAQAWEVLKNRIEYFHVKDCLADGTVVPCGKGIGQVPRLIGEFLAMGGRQLTLEPHLTVFEGFADLEPEDAKTKMEAFTYPDQRSAFDAAVTALKECLA